MRIYPSSPAVEGEGGEGGGGGRDGYSGHPRLRHPSPITHRPSLILHPRLLSLLAVVIPLILFCVFRSLYIMGKRPFSNEEVDLILAQKLLGGKWSDILEAYNQAFHPERSLGSIRSVYYDLVKDSRSRIRILLPASVPSAAIFGIQQHNQINQVNNDLNIQFPTSTSSVGIEAADSLSMLLPLCIAIATKMRR